MLFAKTEPTEKEYAQFMTEMDDALNTVCVFSETKECPSDVRLAVHQLARLMTVK